MNDPLNQHVVSDAIGSQSVLEADGYSRPDWTYPDPAAVPGELLDLRITSKALRREAHVTVYVPARMRRDRRMPLLVVHDGGDFLDDSSMGTVLDNLMHRRLIADCLAVFQPIPATAFENMPRKKPTAAFSRASSFRSSRGRFSCAAHRVAAC